MNIRAILHLFIVAILYPLWLLAGLFDYLCHRWTNIAATSGLDECRFHIAQFAVLGVALAVASILQVTWLTATILISALLIHSALAYLDVRYTQDKRYISPFEQTVHGFLDVLPIIAGCLFLVIHGKQLQDAGWELRVVDNALSLARMGLVGSYGLLVGCPVYEEWRRTSRQRYRLQQS